MPQIFYLYLYLYLFIVYECLFIVLFIGFMLAEFTVSRHFYFEPVPPVSGKLLCYMT